MSGTANERFRVPLADTAIGDEEVAAVTRVLHSGWVTAGPETEAFEREFAERVGVRHAVAVSSGSAALHLAHLALGIGEGHEVICPSLSFVASANATRHAGAEVVFADVVGPHDLTVSPEDVRRRITPRTRAITVMHYAGFACDMDAILTLAAEHDLVVIEDCAHAPLAHYRGADGATRAVGSIGAIGCFSFFGNKNLTTGEGGMLTTNDGALAERLRLQRSHGMTTASYDRFRGYAGHYDVTLLGYNYRTDDIRSALGRAQLARLDALNTRRRELFAWYREALEPVASIGLPFVDHPLEIATPHILSVVVDTSTAVLCRRLNDHGIQTSKHYDPINTFAIYGADASATPVAASLNLLTLPFGPHLSRERVDEIVRLCREN